MTATIKPLIASKYAPNTLTTEYVATGCKTGISKFTATNVSASNATITVHIVATGGTAGTSNAICFTRTIVPNETYKMPEIVGHFLEIGGFIAVVSSASNAIVIRCSGIEYTS